MAKKKRSGSRAYLGLSYTVSLILAILPPTAFVFGVIQRFIDGKPVAAILRIIFGWNIVWILDLIFMIVKKNIFKIINC